jgi:hypothetical protein
MSTFYNSGSSSNLQKGVSSTIMRKLADSHSHANKGFNRLSRILQNVFVPTECPALKQTDGVGDVIVFNLPNANHPSSSPLFTSSPSLTLEPILPTTTIDPVR